VNPRAAAIAELVLWIGYLHWHFRTRGRVAPPEPIIKNFHNIECRAAVLAFDLTEPVLDAQEGSPTRGQPVTRWDGRTVKKHPVTGEDVPDETARVPLLSYVNPRPADWPEADFIVGNPPFIGTARMRDALGSWLGVGNDPVYTKSRCFAPFPFPTATEAQQTRIRDLVERLDAHRKRQPRKNSAPRTRPFGVRWQSVAATPLWQERSDAAGSPRRARAEPAPSPPAPPAHPKAASLPPHSIALTAKEREIPEHGLVTVLRQLHDDLAAAVAEASALPPTATDDATS